MFHCICCLCPQTLYSDISALIFFFTVKQAMPVQGRLEGNSQSGLRVALTKLKADRSIQGILICGQAERRGAGTDAEALCCCCITLPQLGFCLSLPGRWQACLGGSGNGCAHLWRSLVCSARRPCQADNCKCALRNLLEGAEQLSAACICHRPGILPERYAI